jgi:integrating conjugative element protein (TIGR03757 family)
MTCDLTRGEPSRLLMGVCACTLAANTTAANICVVTDGGHPVTHASGARVIELDAPSRLEDRLSAQLPADPAQARAIVRWRLRSGGAALQQRFADAYQGVTYAWSLGITKIPAVVINGRYVVYGVSDVNRAVAMIDAYRKEQQ